MSHTEVEYFQDQKYDDIKADLLRKGEMFQDPHFPLDVPSSTFQGNPQLASSMRWARPAEIYDNPVFVEGISRFDLDQGALGDCWFISGTGDFAMRSKKMFDRVVPPDQSFKDGEYAGIFRFRFWRFGKWVEVVVDDRLPMCPDIVGKLLFCHNKANENEFWSPLIEKAYAKLHNGYAGIVGGQIQNALIDYTGGISEVIKLDDAHMPEDLYEMIETTLKMNSMLGCAINCSPRAIQDKLPNGLYEGHAYALTGIAEVTDKDGNKHQLVRVRNPWGKGEWNGPWNDHSSDWENVSEDEKARIHYQDKQNGEFWMSYNDWKTNFQVCSMCHLTPDSLTDEIAVDDEKDQWSMDAHSGAWVQGQTAGGCGNAGQDMLWKNPQYHFKLTEDHAKNGKCQVVISLMLKYQRLHMHTSIGYQLFKVKDDFQGTLTPENYGYKLQAQSGSTAYSNVREVCKRWNLDPGNYVVIPTTFQPNQEAHFYLRVFCVRGTPLLSHLTHDFHL